MKSQSSNLSTEQDTVESTRLPEHKPLTTVQSMLLTIKVSAVAGAVLAAIWAFDALVN